MTTDEYEHDFPRVRTDGLVEQEEIESLLSSLHSGNLRWKSLAFKFFYDSMTPFITERFFV